MLDFWLRMLHRIAAKLLEGSRKDVEKQEKNVAVEEDRTKVAKVTLKHSKSRETKAKKVSQALSQ